MKTKNNTFKRIAAGALATISVATNVMSANVGGSPFVDAIRASLVAQAVDGEAQVDFSGINQYLTSFSNGTTTFDANALSGLEGFKAKVGDTITVKSSIPLTFNKKVDESVAHLEGAVQGTDGQWYKKDDLINPTKVGYEYTADVKSRVDKATNGISAINGTTISVEDYDKYEYYNVESGTITRDPRTNNLYSTVGADTAPTKYKFENRLYSVPAGEGTYKVATPVEDALAPATYTIKNTFIAYDQNAEVATPESISANATGNYTYFLANNITENDMVKVIDGVVTVLEKQITNTAYTVKDTDEYYDLEGNKIQSGTNLSVDITYYIKKAGVAPATFAEALDVATYSLKENVSAYADGSAGFAGIVSIPAASVTDYTYYNSITSSVKQYYTGTNDVSHMVVEETTDNDGTYKFDTIAIPDMYGTHREITAMTDGIIAKDLYTATDGYFLSADNPPVAANATAPYGVAHDDNAPDVYVVDNMKVGYAEVNGNFYEVAEEAANGVTEAEALKNGKVYATKSGNSFVYTYKVKSAIEIFGQQTTVEITNGLPNAYTTAQDYNGLTPAAKALCAWGDTTDNALLKGIRPVVSDLTFDSDIIEDAAPIAEYDENALNSTNVTGKLAAYKNENVVLSSSNYFKVRIWDGNQKTAYKEYATKFNSKTNKWECTFPTYVEANGNITRVLVEKADPVYTYTTNGSVLSVSGSGIDSEAAYIKAYAVSKADAEANHQGKPDSEAAKKKYAITSNTTQSYGSSVYVDIERIAEFASAKNSVNEYSTLKITRNGKEIIGTDDPDTANTDETVKLGATQHTDKYDASANEGAGADVITDRAQNFTFKQPGEYEITYTVYINANKTTAVAKELKFKFTIDTQAKLTASNVKLTFSASEDDIITGATYNGTTKKYEKVVTGAENLKLPVDVEDLKNKSIDVTATLVNAQGNNLPIDVILSGATTVNELNLSQPLYITYNNDQYSTGSETIVINWQAVSKAKQFNIFQPDGEKPLYTEAGVVNGNNYEVNVSVDEIADIQKIVENNYVLKNGDAKKISYEYSVGKGDKLESQELDWHEAGFPKEIGEYSLYILYANEPIAIIDLNVIKHSLHAAPTASQLNITYGDKLFTEEELGYADAEGKAVKDAAVKNPEIKFYQTAPVEDAQVKQIVDGKLNGVTVYEKDGKYYTLGNAVVNPYDAPLNAGVYVAEIKAKNGNATTVGKADYTLMSDTFVLSVAKKQITADMITIAPKNYIADYHTIGKNAGDIVGKDTAITKNFAGAPTEVKLKIASGEQSGKNIGGYTVNVTVDDKENNYTGTVKNFKWYIIKGAEKDGENYSGLFWNDTETTIVDNGNINVEFGKSANLVGEVVEFGFIGDKSGKIGAPTKGTYTDNKSSGIYNYSNNFNATTGAALNTLNNPNADTNVQAAYSELVYGAGINPAKQNAAMIAKKGADTFGVSVRIEDANTGVWVRPYLILKVDGEEKLYYGEVRYLNLVEEATAMLNLKASAMGAANNNDHVAQEAVTKDQAKAQYADNSDLAYMEDAKSGYWAEKNQFYAYAHYNFDKNSKVKDSAIQGFGVVLDKSGYIPAGAFGNDGALDKTTDAYKKACEVLIPANKGKNGILSGISKDNPKMLKNEMGVAVNPKDAVTGVWLRSFVDFGNGLIVYTDPVYIKSVSEQYADCKPGVEGKKADNAAKINYTVTANAKGNVGDAAVIPKFKGANAVIKEAGVVVDKNGTLFKLNDAGYYTGWVDDIKTKFIADNATANGYNKGKKGIDINPATVGTTIFTGHAFQVTNKSGNYIKTVARPFVVYTINGKDITIYGEPVVDTTGDATYPEVAKG